MNMMLGWLDPTPKFSEISQKSRDNTLFDKLMATCAVASQQLQCIIKNWKEKHFTGRGKIFSAAKSYAHTFVVVNVLVSFDPPR